MGRNRAGMANCVRPSDQNNLRAEIDIAAQFFSQFEQLRLRFSR